MLGIVGDINLDMNKIHTDSNVEMLYDSLLECGLTHVIRTSTRSSLYSASIIDQIFLNMKLVLLSKSNAAITGNAELGITDPKL